MKRCPTAESTSAPAAGCSRSSRPTFVAITNSSRGRRCSARPSRSSATPEAVQRRGVEEPDAGIPGGIDDRSRLLVAHRREETAQWRAAHREL